MNILKAIKKDKNIRNTTRQLLKERRLNQEQYLTLKLIMELKEFYAKEMHAV